ncbi:hypothetical protein HYX00_03990 [Candidatus Woesearchaeota archaeon]|nr:hypothetical protein [Candidatus Woesearchaeota archaeon]
MVKVKKFLSIFVVVFLILSNIAFAQYTNSLNPSSYEGRPIDPSKEGKEYNREGNVIVYPAQISSKEKEMMERVARGELSEEEMRGFAKAKMGDRFSEEEFESGMMEFKDRMNRKEAFSYEHEGYEPRYYVGPSFEGYSKEHMVYALVFEHIGDEIDPREIKENCNEPEKIADKVISKLKEKVGDLQKLCSQAEEQESKCNEMSKKTCSQIGTAFVREDASEIEKIQSVAFSCPVNKDAIVEACKKRSKFHMEQRLQNLDESCKQRFDFEGERLVRECERFKQHQLCDKEKYIKQCTDNFGVKREDFDESGKRKPICPKYPVPDCGAGSMPQTKIDTNGCEYHYCQAVQQKTECGISDCGPALGMPNYLCSDGKTTAGPTGRCLRHADGRCGWEIVNCPTTTTCPHVAMPMCAVGTTVEKRTDEKGCIQYYCAAIPCPSVQKLACKTDETLQTYYDNRGCVTSYQCIKHEIQCPEVARATCAEGQNLITRYDDRRCVVGYECISVTTTATAPTTQTSEQQTTTTTSQTSTSTTQPTETTATSTGTTTGTSTSTNSGATASASTTVTGQVVLNTYEDFSRHCENNWREQERICQNTPNVCDKSDFIEKCKEQERKGYSDFISRMEGNCETQTISEVKSAEQRCSRIDEDRKRCSEDSSKRCEHMKGIAQQCKDLMTEEKLRNFIIGEAKKRCKFTEIMQNENDVRKAEKAEIVFAVLNTATKDDFEKLGLFVDNLHEDLKLQDTTVYKGTIEPNRFRDIKLLPFVVNAKLSAVPSAERAKEVKARIVAGQKAEEAASKLVSLRDSDVPSEYLYIIEDKASDVLNVSNKLDEIEKKEEQKGIGYKVRLFLGLAKRAEQEEIKQLEESKEKLKKSIETLAKLSDEVPSDVAKSILKEQVGNLKNQQEDIEVLIETKEKKSKGLLGIFG